MQKLLILLSIFIMGCAGRAKVNPVMAEKNKDVIILSMLIRSHLKQSHERFVDLSELIQSDTLKRIAANFDKIEFIARGGHIAVYYTFSKSRVEDKIDLTTKEKELLSWPLWKERKRARAYDGEIRFAYGERFYHIKKIIVKKE